MGEGIDVSQPSRRRRSAGELLTTRRPGSDHRHPGPKPEATRFQRLTPRRIPVRRLHLPRGMKNVSPRIPEMADERTILEMVRDMLELDIKLEPRPGGVRITIDPDTTSRFEPVPVGA